MNRRVVYQNKISLILCLVYMSIFVVVCVVEMNRFPLDYYLYIVSILVIHADNGWNKILIISNNGSIDIFDGIYHWKQIWNKQEKKVHEAHLTLYLGLYLGNTSNSWKKITTCKEKLQRKKNAEP